MQSSMLIIVALAIGLMAVILFFAIATPTLKMNLSETFCGRGLKTVTGSNPSFNSWICNIIT
ncbi:MAG: hypothetical protein V1678_03105 [Candidatus Aenigmatarchaeota archaeon]